MSSPPNPDAGSARPGPPDVPSLVGYPVVGRGRTADVVRLPGGCVAKVFAAWRPADAIAREAAVSEVVASLPHTGYLVPRVHGLRTVADADGTERRALVLDEVQGRELLDGMGSRPWTLVGAARLLADVHAAIGVPRRPGELAALPVLVDRWRAQIDAVADVLGHSHGSAAERLAELAVRDHDVVVCHGDFHPGNVFVDRTHLPAVIDWTNAARGPAAADVAMTLVLLACGELPGEGPMRRVMAAGRSAFAAVYRRRMAALAPDLLQAAEEWVPAVAAARLADGPEGEQADLLAIVRAGGL